MNPKCPHCDSIMTRLVTDQLPASLGSSTKRVLVISCPLCHRALSAQIDPFALNSELEHTLGQRHQAPL